MFFIYIYIWVHIVLSLEYLYTGDVFNIELEALDFRFRTAETG